MTKSLQTCYVDVSPDYFPSQDAAGKRFEKLREILVSIGYTHLLNVFKSEDIDDITLENIDWSDKCNWEIISNILPTAGAKLKFRAAVLNINECSSEVVPETEIEKKSMEFTSYLNPNLVSCLFARLYI